MPERACRLQFAPKHRRGFSREPSFLIHPLIVLQTEKGRARKQFMIYHSSGSSLGTYRPTPPALAEKASDPQLLFLQAKRKRVSINKRGTKRGVGCLGVGARAGNRRVEGRGALAAWYAWSSRNMMGLRTGCGLELRDACEGGKGRGPGRRYGWGLGNGRLVEQE